MSVTWRTYCLCRKITLANDIQVLLQISIESGGEWISLFLWCTIDCQLYKYQRIVGRHEFIRQTSCCSPYQSTPNHKHPKTMIKAMIRRKVCLLLLPYHWMWDWKGGILIRIHFCYYSPQTFLVICLLFVLLATNCRAQPTTYSQVRLQMPQVKFEPVVGMSESEIQEFDHQTMKHVKSIGDEEEMLKKVNSHSGRSYHESTGDTLESLIEWLNKPSNEESSLQNVIWLWKNECV